MEENGDTRAILIIAAAAIVFMAFCCATNNVLAGLLGRNSKADWDKSSLKFEGDCESSCEDVTLTICNRGDGDMQGGVGYELWYKELGNPKNGEIYSQGTTSALGSDECQDITIAVGKNGNYKMKAYQREGHPGSGELWSETCAVFCGSTTTTIPNLECEGCKIQYYEKQWNGDECEWVFIYEMEVDCRDNQLPI